MKERAGKKKVVLELGGNAGVIVDKSADLDWAVQRTLVGAFAYAGQVCISVQRIFLHEDIREAFLAKFVEGVKALKLGDPIEPDTDVGPMVDDGQAQRTQRWVDEAVQLGGNVVIGGRAKGAFFEPTVLENVPLEAQVCSNEAFAPLVVVFGFSDFADAVRQVNDSSFGLQTGVFTNDLDERLARRSTSSRSAASSSTTSRPTGSTTCPTAASRTGARAERASAGRSRT